MSLTELFDELERVKAERDHLEDLIEEVRAEAADIKKTFKNDDDLKAENATLKEEYGEAENQIKEYQAEIAELEDKIEAFSNRGESDG